MTRKQVQNERGQILILLVVGMVGLVGFAALAIDGGMTLSDRRTDQNAADAAALAGGKAAGVYMQGHDVFYETFTCASESIFGPLRNAARNAAVARAADNDFTITPSINPGPNNVWIENCTNNMFDQYFDVHVRITTTTQTSFIHFVYDGPVVNTVDAIVRVRPGHDYGFGHTIVGLRLTCDGGDGGVKFDGNNTVTIQSGGVFSNACLEANGTSLIVDVVEDIFYRTSFTPSGSPVVSPAPTLTPVIFKKPSQTPPPCPSPVQPAPHVGGTTTINPGSYESLTVTGNDNLIFNPGLYCFYGDVKFTGGDSITGDGITIYMLKDSHNNPTTFTVSGGTGGGGGGGGADLATFHLSAPTGPKGTPICTKSGVYTDICPDAIKGMLIYMAVGNTGEVTIQGNSSSTFDGTVLVPDGTIDIGGTNNSATEIGVQAIADTVKVHGNVTLTFHNDPDDVSGEPAKMDQWR